MRISLFRGSISITGRKPLRASLQEAGWWMRGNCLRKRSCSLSMQGLVKLRIMDEELTEEDMKTVGELVNRVEEIVPELHREERKFDVSRLLDALSMGNGMER